jgi:hypothetical protein
MYSAERKFVMMYVSKTETTLNTRGYGVFLMFAQILLFIWDCGACVVGGITGYLLYSLNNRAKLPMTLLEG